MSFFEEGFAPPPEPEPELTDRPYGEVIPFDLAFHPVTVFTLGLKIGREHPLWLAGIGMGVLVAAVIVPIEVRIPLPSALETSFRSNGASLVVGYLVHRALSLDLSALLSTVVGGAALSAVSRWVRGQEGGVRTLIDHELWLWIVVYEVASLMLGFIVALPFVVLAMFFSGLPMMLLVMAAVSLTLAVSAATRPGLWAMCIDRLTPRDAFVGGIVGAARHPKTLLLLYGAYVLALLASVGAFAFLVIGVFQLGIAASWVGFAASESELAELPLLKDLPR